MTDLGGGIHATRVDAEEFEFDPDPGGFTHLLFDEGGASAGLWKPEPGRVYEDHIVPSRETILVLAGSVIIEVQDGPTLQLLVGDVATFPAGTVSTWRPSPGFKELWLYA